MKELRRKKLKSLEEKFGTRAALARALGESAGYLYQLIKGIRPVTENTTLKFEEKLSLKPGWFSDNQDIGNDDLPLFVLPDGDEANNLFIYYLQADQRGKDTILALAKIEASRAEPAESEQSAKKKNPYASDRIPTKSEPDKQSQKNADPFSEDRIATAGSGTKKRTTKKKPTKKK